MTTPPTPPAPTEQERAEAERIVSELWHDWRHGEMGESWAVNIILKALSARRPAPGHVLDEHVVERKVLGSLPLTADGCVVGDGASLMVPLPYDGFHIAQTFHSGHTFFYGGGMEQITVPCSKCYSTRSAAESARAGKQGGEG